MAKAKLPRVILVTSCSVTRTETPVVKVRDIPPGTMKDALNWWTAQLDQHEKNKKVLRTPGELYRGIAYDTIAEISHTIGRENVYIVTGGQGLIYLDLPIVPYDFTSDKSMPENIHKQVTGEKFVPATWWRWINAARGRGEAPVAALLQEHPDAYIVGALPKGFIKYLADDLAQIPPDVQTQRVFIPVPRSMLTSFPKTITRCLVPYESGLTAGLSYTRYNKQHVVTKRFLQLLLEGHTQGKAFADTAADIITQATKEAAQRVLAGTEDVDYDEMFEEHPDLLKCPSPAQAIKLAKILNIPYGGKHRFAAAWRGATGQRAEALDVDNDTASRGKAALEQLFNTEEQGKSATTNSDSQLLQEVALFVRYMRESHPDRPFTAAMVAAWGEITFGQEHNSGITSAVKLVYILEFNATFLGIKADRVGGKLQFRLA